MRRETRVKPPGARLMSLAPGAPTNLYAIDLCAPMVYNAHMIFVETRLFTSRILDAMSDDEYASLQNHLSNHPDAGAMIPGTGGVRKIQKELMRQIAEEYKHE